MIAAACLAFAVLALVLQAQVGDAATQLADTEPFVYDDGNRTIVGLRVLGATPGDLVRVPEVSRMSACGGWAKMVPWNETSHGWWWASSGVVVVRSTGWDPSNLTVPEYSYANLTFFAAPSGETPEVINGSIEGAYRYEQRGNWNSWSSYWAAWPPNFSRITFIPSCGSFQGVSVRVHGGNHRWDNSTFPGLALSGKPGTDFGYIVQRSDNDDENYTALSEALRRDAANWWAYDGPATIEQSWSGEANNALGALVLVSTGVGGIFLGLGLRRQPRPVSTSDTEASLDLAMAGERHLRLLRNAWIMLGCLVVPLLGAGTLAVAAMTALRESYDPFGFSALGLVLAIDAGLLVLWALTMRQIQADLRGWRAAWSTFQKSANDVL